MTSIQKAEQAVCKWQVFKHQHQREFCHSWDQMSLCVWRSGAECLWLPACNCLRLLESNLMRSIFLITHLQQNLFHRLWSVSLAGNYKAHVQERLRSSHRRARRIPSHDTGHVWDDKEVCVCVCVCTYNAQNDAYGTSVTSASILKLCGPRRSGLSKHVYNHVRKIDHLQTEDI
jgi:hypothetical protein